jgi:hypothetical protein
MKKILIALAFCVAGTQAIAATAYWTGEQQMVQTVTFQTAWRCTYNYNGQYIYQLHQGSCPQSIQVF